MTVWKSGIATALARYGATADKDTEKRYRIDLGATTTVCKRRGGDEMGDYRISNSWLTRRIEPDEAAWSWAAEQLIGRDRQPGPMEVKP
jgi:hypothetical protein